jgi:DNA modification methylase
MKLLLGDCLDKLKELEENSIDSIVTDPPYGLSFMGKKWDYDVPSTEIWEECMRVLKPGGYLLSFAGSRTYHRMAVRVEDAGFEIRDQIMWIYGSGFPKSQNISKMIDKKGGQNLSWFIDYVLEVAKEKNISKKELTMLFPSKNGKSTGWLWNKKKTQGITLEQYNTLKDFLDLPFDNIQEAEREVIGRGKSGLTGGTIANFSGEKEFDITTSSTDKAKQYEGWGTALKPAHEPIVMARKPLSEKTVADNVLEWGTGGINIDDSRITMSSDDEEMLNAKSSKNPTSNYKESTTKKYGDYEKDIATPPHQQGRFPANIIFDEEAGKILDEQSGISKSTGGRSGNKEGVGQNGIYGQYKGEVRDENPGLGDVGGASRFFYCPKTSKRDRNEGLDGFEEKKSRKWRDDKGMKLTGSGNPRNEMSKNFHPTVKPTDLMLYLIRMVTPKGGTTLDPFMGSGSTGKAAIRGGFDFVGIEREEEYMEIAEARIQYEIDNPYNEETKTRTEVKSEVKKTVNKFFSF